jgi:hypothetical protein
MPLYPDDDHSQGHASHADRGAPTPGEILYDRHRTNCFEVIGVDAEGVALRQADHEFYIPHSLFIPWYGSRLFPLEETANIDPPEWL